MSAARTLPEPLTMRRGPTPAGRVLPLLVLSLFLGLGIYLRVAQLGQGDFGVDELFQAFAARGLMETGEPRLPSGELYTRGIDVTHLTRWSFEHNGIHEGAARLPSAAFGVIGLFLFAAVLWALGGPWVAVVGTALFAVYPEAVRQSRELRFYTYQLMFGIGALYTGWQAVAADPGATLHSARARLEQWGWMVATAALLLLATRVQVVTMSVLAAWGACLLLAAAAELRAQGAPAWRTSPVVQTVAAGMLGLLAVLLARPGVVAEVVASGRDVPSWITTAEGGTTPLAYYYSLSETYPLLLALLPVIFLAAILRTGRLGVYLSLWFGIPLFLHSFVLLMKGARFVLIPMLALFVASAIAAVWCAQMARDALVRRAGAGGLSPRRTRVLVGAGLAMVALFAFASLPALHRARKMVGGKSTRWSTAAEIMRARPDLAGVPIGHTQTLHPFFYWGRIDFELGDPRRRPAGAADAPQVERRMGAPILHTAEQIRHAHADAGAVILGLDTDMVAAGRIDPDLVRTVTSEGEELCRRRCDKLNLYYWRFDGPVAPPRPGGAEPAPLTGLPE